MLMASVLRIPGQILSIYVINSMIYILDKDEHICNGLIVCIYVMIFLNCLFLWHCLHYQNSYFYFVHECCICLCIGSIASFVQKTDGCIADVQQCVLQSALLHPISAKHYIWIFGLRSLQFLYPPYPYQFSPALPIMLLLSAPCQSLHPTCGTPALYSCTAPGLYPACYT